MVKRLLCLFLSAMLVLCVPAAAFAEGTTPTPRLDCTSFMCDEDSKTSSGYKWDYIVLSYSDPDTGETRFYSKDAKVKLYSSSGGTASGISVKVNTSRDARGKLCIGHIDFSVSTPPSQSTSYYLAVTESGMGESSRIKITVKPFENTESLIQKLTGETYSALEDDVGSKQQALDVLLKKLRAKAEGSGISIGSGEISNYTAAAYGKNGRLDARVSLSTGDSIKVTLVIIANEYDGPMPETEAAASTPKPSTPPEEFMLEEWLLEEEQIPEPDLVEEEERVEEASDEDPREAAEEEREEEATDNTRVVPLEEMDYRIPKTG